ncbi:MAG: hypothetical protein G8237_15435 [Magnetococcales bacterium]|nr:hypothetical protein [Magnetococcales bacterium]
MSAAALPRPTAPRWLTGLVILALIAQIGWHLHLPDPTPSLEPLPSPPSLAMLHLSSLGDPVAGALFWMLWLQGFDEQSGVTLVLRTMDYQRLATWLERILALDPDSSYPLLAAIRVYGFVPDPKRQRLMLDFVHRSFLALPSKRWEWLAFAALQARHRLKDAGLARFYLNDLEKNLDTGNLPFWVRGLHGRILLEQNELAGARKVMGGILVHEQASEPKKQAMVRWLERLEEQQQLLEHEK